MHEPTTEIGAIKMTPVVGPNGNIRELLFKSFKCVFWCV